MTSRPIAFMPSSAFVFYTNASLLTAILSVHPGFRSRSCPLSDSSTHALQLLFSSTMLLISRKSMTLSWSINPYLSRGFCISLNPLNFHLEGCSTTPALHEPCSYLYTPWIGSNETLSPQRLHGNDLPKTRPFHSFFDHTPGPSFRLSTAWSGELSLPSGHLWRRGGYGLKSLRNSRYTSRTASSPRKAIAATAVGLVQTWGESPSCGIDGLCVTHSLKYNAC